MSTMKNIRRQVAYIMAFVMFAGFISFSGEIAKAGTDNKGAWGDLGNGYYNNPVLPADYSDPDIIRVDNDYYLITSTFVQSPGITVLHSTDLVNWEIIGAAVKDLTQINAKYNWDSMSGYGRGIWAPCISYNSKNQRFYIHFGDPDFGMYMTYTDDIYSNNWSDLQEVVKLDGTGFGAGWNDCGMLWDEDGQGYFAATHFADGYKDYIFKIDENGYQLQDEGVLVHQTDDGLYVGPERNPEALKLFKKDGLYYFYHNGIESGKRKAFIMRSESIYGKHESGELGTFENPGKYEHIPYPIVEGTREPNQGNLIDIVDDNGDTKWFFWTHQGSTDLDGRPNSLVPITWNSDGWPVAGYQDIKQAGAMVWENIKKPLANSEIKRPQTSDEFETNQLGLQWMWNCQPRDEYWSLAEREGFLRLKAFQPVRNDSLDRAGNSIIQRMYRTNGNVVKTKMDISNMADGQFAGLLYIMGGRTAGIGVSQSNGIRQIRYKGDSDSLGEGIPSDVQYVYLKSEWENSMLTKSYYSFDGITYQQFGEEFQITKSNYRGGHIGFFNFNNLSDSGYVDFDYLQYEMDVNEKPPVIMGVDNGGVYDLPVNIRFSRGTATLNGVEITNGYRLSKKGEYTLEVKDGDKVNSIILHSKVTDITPTPDNGKGIQVDFTDSSAIEKWSNTSNVSFHQNSLIGNYMIADGAAANLAPKTPAFVSDDNMIVEFDMMIPSKKADGVTDNLIEGGNTGGVALMQGNNVAGVVGFRGNGQGQPDNIISKGGTGKDYLNALAGNKATAYFDTWMHYIFVIDTANKKGDIYMIDPSKGTVYNHEGRLDQYMSSITDLTHIGIVSDKGYSIAVANLNVHQPNVTSISLSAENNMTSQYVPGEGNVSTLQYSAEARYRLTYNKNGTVTNTYTNIKLAQGNIEYSILDESGKAVNPQGMQISGNGLLEIQSNAAAGKYQIMASCGEVSDQLPLEIIADAQASSVQIYGEEDVILGENKTYQYQSIALADSGAVLPEKATTWAFEGDSLGCTISENGLLTIGDKSGKVTIRAVVSENGVSSTFNVYLRTAQEEEASKVNVQGVFLSDGKTAFTDSNGIMGVALNAKQADQNVKMILKVYDKSNVCLQQQEYTIPDMKKQVFGFNTTDIIGLNKASYVRVIVVDEQGNIISSKMENLTAGIYKGIPIVSDWVTGKKSGLGMGGAVLTPEAVPAGIDPNLVNTYTSEAKYDYTNYDAVINEKVATNNLLWYKTGAWSADKSATIYSRDGKDWEEQALPIGNGYMGGMLFGMPAKDHIQFNEETFWAAGYRGVQNETSPSYVNPNMSEGINGFMNAGNVFVDFGMNRGETVTNYYRDLNLDEGVAHVQYEYNGVKYNREYFASYPKEVIALNYSADKDGALNFTVHPVSAHPGDITVENGEITIVGKLKDSEPYKGGGNAEWNQESDLEYCTKVKVILNDGTGEIIDEYGNVAVKNAKNVTVLICAATDYDPNQFVLNSDGSVNTTKTPYKDERGVQAAIDKATTRMNNASAMAYTDLKAEHMKDYQSQFNKVNFSLTGGEVCKTPTNELQQSYKNAVGTKTNTDGTTSVSYDNTAYKNLDKHLEELHYNYARYMMISSSRATTMPATLQGKWCQSVSEIWGSCYCININMEMNYWFAGGANLLDSGKALVHWFDSQIPAGRITAKNMYKVTPKSYTYADGAMKFEDSGEDKDDVFIMHTKQAIMGTTDMTGSTNIQSAGNTAWLMYNLWDLYQTTGDKTLLKDELYPIMRKAANFYTQYLYTNMKKTTTDTQKYPDGYYYTTWKGRSPEQGPTQEGIKYDLQLVAGMYDYTIQAAEALGIDSDKVAAWKEIRNHLEIPVELGDDGQIKEWAQETSYNTDSSGKALGDPVHRHISHLVGLYPGTLINRETPELLNGAKIVLEKRGDDATGWSCSNKFLLWARTLEGDKALELFRYQLAQKTYSNLFDTHAPFQIDGNFGSAAAVMELLMQSHTGETYILPALPTQWDKGEISGIKAKDGSEVSIQWSEGKADEFTIAPAVDGDITVGYEKENNAFLLNGEYVEFGKDGLYTIRNAKAGEKYTFTSTAKIDRGITLTRDHVNAYGFESGTLIVAGYDENGVMLKMEMINGLDADILGYDECDKIEAFLWDGIDSMQPLCESVELYRQ